MARPDARAVAGYYAAQRNVVEACARIVGRRWTARGRPCRTWRRRRGPWSTRVPRTVTPR